ncbi:MAG: hypothetical protein RLN72_11655, partial [Henriciella sp.]
RCQTLRLRPLNTEDTLAVLEQNGVANAKEAADLVKGRPGRADQLTGPKTLAASVAARDLLKALPSANEAVLSSALLAAGEDDTTFRVFANEVLGWLEKKTEHDASWADVWFESQQILSEQRNLHMTALQAASKMLGSLQTAFETR